MVRSQIIWNTLGRRKYVENPRAVEKLTYLGAVMGSWQWMTPGRSWHPEPSSGRQNLRDPMLPASIARGQQDLPLRRKSARIVSWQDLDPKVPSSECICSMTRNFSLWFLRVSYTQVEYLPDWKRAYQHNSNVQQCKMHSKRIHVELV